MQERICKMTEVFEELAVVVILSRRRSHRPFISELA